MSTVSDEDYSVNLKYYTQLIETNPDVDRKGASMPYTSLNSHMFSFLSK